MPRRQRPAGEHTRGKTAENRLRQVDVYTALAMPAVLRGGSPLCIDLGFGARPWTALEMAQRFARVNPDVRVLGVEIDPARVEFARPFAEPPRIDFALGGFNLENVTGPGAVRLVRAYNVLRQYDEADVATALAQMARAIEPGGVLIEGTSNPTGAMVAFDVWRKPREGAPASDRVRNRGADQISSLERATGLVHVALVFGTNFREVHQPSNYQTILPKRLIHRMLGDEPARFFADWATASEIARAAGAHASRREQWALAADVLRERFGWPIDPRRRLLARGFMALRQPLV